MPAALLWWLVAINLVTAAAYAYDKLAAPRGGRRIRSGRCGSCASRAASGAWLVFFGMRHKTQHQSFWIVQTLRRSCGSSSSRGCCWLTPDIAQAASRMG